MMNYGMLWIIVGLEKASFHAKRRFAQKLAHMDIQIVRCCLGLPKTNVSKMVQEIQLGDMMDVEAEMWLRWLTAYLVEEIVDD